ncbi:MAG: YegP family protein [Oscillospiraceae bacterium]|nr:YegP family protein [Oscillospiraceae bacterium]
MGKFVIRNTKTGIKFDLKANNGEVIATSEVYKSEASCKKGIASVRRNAPVAAVEDQTVEGFAKEKHPKFEIYVDKAGEFRFRLKATNGQIIAVSEGYKAMAGCKNGIASVKKNAVDAPVVDAKE